MIEEKVLEDTIEHLDEKMKTTLSEISNIATRVQRGELDAYEGFLETEKYNKIVLDIGNKLKEKGVDVTQIEEYQDF